MSKTGVKFVAISAFKTQLIKMHQNHLECFNLMKGGVAAILINSLSGKFTELEFVITY